MATPAEQIHAVFRDWDKAGSGVISASQLRSVLVSIAGAALSEQDIDSLLLQIYGSFDAPSVDWRQFISFICQSNAPSGADSPKASLKATDSATKPRKGASLLLKGLKSGEVGKLLDQMEDTEAPAPAPEKDTPPKDSPTSTSASTTAAPAPATRGGCLTTNRSGAPSLMHSITKPCLLLFLPLRSRYRSRFPRDPKNETSSSSSPISSLHHLRTIISSPQQHPHQHHCQL
mmetsp:Transcript_76246/g.166461  ORF Transcript_76246/g.166461 Transcript_76246/m.166461 type:complete len:231 (-) Transcript_76246:1424-2116(-)